LEARIKDRVSNGYFVYICNASMKKITNQKLSLPFLGTLTEDQIREGKERFLSAVNGTKQKPLAKTAIKKQGKEFAI
jgi:hypothetical protein